MRKIVSSICLLLVMHCYTNAQNYGLNLESIYTWNDGLNDCWGYTDANGNEFALVGLLNGISVLDITNPTNAVEVYNIPRNYSIWRDLKFHNGYAYAVDDQEGGQLIIIDLTDMNNISHTQWTTTGGGGSNFTKCHDIWIDENGFAYLFGCNNGVPTGQRGAIILDLNGNPTNPQYVGFYNDNYIHDGYVKDNIMWSAEIYAGHVAIVDVTDKANPVVLNTIPTPDDFTHNCWLSDDGTVLFTTDERQDAYVGVYDVSDINNVQELDRYQSSPGQNVIPHNVFSRGNFAITSYYADGVVVHDATYPDNVIQVGAYDTAPAYTGTTFEGCWGTYIGYPSGKIIASDQQNGLHIFTPSYTQAAYLEGSVFNGDTGAAIFNVNVSIAGIGVSTTTDFVGQYKTGYRTAGTYNVTFSASGYQSQTIPVTMQNGVLTIENVFLAPNGLNKITLASAGLLGGTISGSLMNDDLRVAGYIPTTEPYTALGYTNVGGGGETVSSNVLNVTGTNAIVDWIFVELRSTLTNVVATRCGLIQRDGDIVDVDGTSKLEFLNTNPDEYYVVIRHRNHLGVMTAQKVNLAGGSNFGLNFADSSVQLYGTNAAWMNGSNRLLWPGNGNDDGQTIYQGNGSDILPITQLVFSSPFNPSFQFSAPIPGYNIQDFNMDGNVVYQGSSSDLLPITQAVFSNPTNASAQVTVPVTEQLP